MLLIYVIFHFLLSRTLFGKHVYAIGGNRETARLSGLPVRRTLAILYVLNGALAGLSGVLLASRLASGNPNSGDGYEFDVITAVYLGCLLYTSRCV